MKLCLIVKQGRPVEVVTVPDDHHFGEHTDHFHLEVPLVDIPSCDRKTR